MKKPLLIALTGLISSVAFGQQITSSDLQVPGVLYKLGVNVDAAPSLTPGGKGTGLSWDFSSLPKDSNDSTGTLIPSKTPYSASFPSASHATLTTDADGKTYSYYTTTASKVEVTGVAYESLQLTGNPKVVLKTVTPVNYYETLPLAFGNKSYSKGTYVGKGKYTGYPTVDSIQVTMVIEKWDTVDASGLIKLPTGMSHDVIRLKTNAKRTMTFIVHSSLTGWTVPPAPYDAPNITESKYYSFWAKGIGNEVFRLEYDNFAATSPTTAYWYLNTVAGIEASASQLNSVSFGPNPASSTLNVLGVSGSYELEISNMQGASMMNKKSLVGEQTLDISGLNPGLYIATLKNSSGAKVKSKIVVQ